MLGGGGEREIIYLSLHCHHQNDSCIKMGSDESHFNVSVGSDGQIAGQCPQTTTFLKRKESRSGTARPNRLTPSPNTSECFCSWLVGQPLPAGFRKKLVSFTKTTKSRF